jgi:hypothetical protein
MTRKITRADRSSHERHGLYVFYLQPCCNPHPPALPPRGRECWRFGSRSRGSCKAQKTTRSGDAPGHATCHPFVQKWTLPLGAKRGDNGGISADRFSEVKPARGLRRGLGGGGERARWESACGRRQRTSIPRGGDGTGWGGARTVFPDWVVSAPSSPACCGTATEGRQGQTWVPMTTLHLLWGQVVPSIPAFCRQLIAALADR